VVYLNDGTRLEGDIHKNGDGWVVTTGPGQRTSLAAGQIKRIELTSNDADPTAADGRLASLRRSAEFSSDAGDMIARYQRFIDQNAGLRAADECGAQKHGAKNGAKNGA